MRKIATLFALLLLGVGFSNVMAQGCVPDSNAVTLDPNVYFGVAGFAPTPLPDATVGEVYNEVIQFKAKRNVPSTPDLPLSFNIDSVKVTGIADQNNGTTYDWVSYEVVSGNPADTGDVFTPINGIIYGCVKMTGTPTNKTCTDSIRLKLGIYTDSDIVDNLIPSVLPGVDVPLKVHGAGDDTCAAVTAIGKLFNGQGVSVYPSPTTGNATVSATLVANTNVAVRVSDISGRIVFSKEFANQNAGNFTTNIPSAQWAAGMYFVNIKVGDQVVTQKFVRSE